MRRLPVCPPPGRQPRVHKRQSSLLALISPLFSQRLNIDKLIFGCTHYQGVVQGLAKRWGRNFKNIPSLGGDPCREAQSGCPEEMAVNIPLTAEAGVLKVMVFDIGQAMR